ELNRVPKPALPASRPTKPMSVPYPDCPNPPNAHKRLPTPLNWLAATPADQHDFLTRVQLLWSLLIEHRRLRAAFDCLMEVSPRVTRLDFDEFQSLLRETFNEAQHVKRRLPQPIA